MTENKGVWLTYEEAAKQLQVKTASVRRRAYSRKWKRQKGNDGLARILVPDSVINPDKRKENDDRTNDYHSDNRYDTIITQLADERVKSGKLEAEVDGLKTRIEEALARTDEIRTERDHWRNLATRREPGLFERIRTRLLGNGRGV